MKSNHKLTPVSALRIISRLMVMLLVAMVVCSLSLSSAGAVHAQGGTPGGSGVGSSGADLGAGGNEFVEVVFTISKRFIQVLAFSSLGIFAAAMARGTFSAQLANLVGSPTGVSHAWMNILAAIFLFLIAVLSPLFVDMVFSVVKGFATTALNNPIPSW